MNGVKDMNEYKISVKGLSMESQTVITALHTRTAEF